MTERNPNSCMYLLDFHCPRYKELPDIGLYMDQVVHILDEVFVSLYGVSSAITPSMINNYVKQGIIQPPVKKKYSRDHMAYLVVICLLKQIFTMSEICTLLEVQQRAKPVGESYDIFCDLLEKSLRYVVLRKEEDNPVVGSSDTYEAKLLRSSILAVAHTLYAKIMTA